jgi:hypothetical protein
LDALMQISYNGMDLEADNMDGMNCHGLPWIWKAWNLQFLPMCTKASGLALFSWRNVIMKWRFLSLQ